VQFSHNPTQNCLDGRLVFDRDTGKPRGYGFCEFAGTVLFINSIAVAPYISSLSDFNARSIITHCLPQNAPISQDHETALSAVRNLNNTDVGGRPLRIDLADSDPFLEGKTTVRGELIDSGESRSQWRERERDHDYYSGGGSRDPNAFLRSLPAGIPVLPGSTAMDMISQTLATMNPNQLMEVLAQRKVYSIFFDHRIYYLTSDQPGLRYNPSGTSSCPPRCPPSTSMRTLSGPSVE
jgi:cleavage stimulation factor subunit 2